MPLRREDLTPIYLKLETVFPPVERFSSQALAELNLAVCQRHSFEGYHLTGDSGAHIYTEGIRDIELDRGNLSITEYVRKSMDIVKRDFCDIVEVIQKHLNIPVFFGPDVLLRALWPVGGDMGSAIQRALQINNDQLRLLKMQIDGAGFVIFGTEESGETAVHHQIRIQPYLSDQTQLFIEVDSHSHEVIETPAVVEQSIQHVYDVLKDSITSFVESLHLSEGGTDGQQAP